MAVKLRLLRMGAKKAPFYRIVAADSRSPRDGRNIEVVGTYNPTKNPGIVTIDEEKALKWLNNGAIPSDTENGVLPDSAYVTISFGTMSSGFNASKVADDITLSLARYQHYLANDSKDVTIVSNPDSHKQANDNHYLFNEQIEASPSFSSDLSFEVTKEVHYSK